MEVILRPVNDQFLQEVVFPAFEQGVIQAGPAFEHLLRYLEHEETRVQLELLLDQHASESFFGLTDDRWNDVVYKLLFSEWLKDGDGWILADAWAAYAGPWEETFHLAMMLEDVEYPYFDEAAADQRRRSFWAQPSRVFSLASMLCGAWDPFPGFPPDQILTTAGTGVYQPQVRVARADWAWRPMLTVSQWAARLPGLLSRLLDREMKRLRPVEAPERHEILDYWLGRIPEPPLLAVSFSGLGPRAYEWIRQLGMLAQLIRASAAEQRGLTVVLSTRARNRDNLMDVR